MVSSDSSSPVRPSLAVFFATAAAGRESRQFDYNPPPIFRDIIFGFYAVFSGFCRDFQLCGSDAGCRESGEHQGGGLMHVARAHGEDEITGIGKGRELRDCFLK